MRATLAIDVEPEGFAELGLIEERLKQAAAELEREGHAVAFRIAGRRRPRTAAAKPRAYAHDTGALRGALGGAGMRGSGGR